MKLTDSILVHHGGAGMKSRVHLIVLLLAAVALLSLGSLATAQTQTTADTTTAICSAHPCNSDADCPRGLVCCSNGFCSTRRGCRQ
jgi:hypothetical protein